MNTLEVGQVWSNDNNTATITNVATSYSDTYIRYTLADNTQHETNLHTFQLYFPASNGTVVETETVEPAAVIESPEVV